MDHARVKALKGTGKTTSNKAIKSGRASKTLTPRLSPNASLFTSPAHSTAPSRAASDVSDDEYDDNDLPVSTASADSFEDEEGELKLSFNAANFIEELQDRKHNNSETREALIEVYIKRLRSRYDSETRLWLDQSAQSLAELFLRTANRGLSARERVLGLQAFVLTVCTTEEVDLYERGEHTIRQIIVDDDDEDCKIWGIYAMAVAVLYGGGGEDVALDVLEYLVDIVQTDGESVEAHDSGPVVAAALRAWAFVASHVADYSDTADVAMDAFTEQLDGDNAEVQACAAFCIALVYESSRNHEHEVGEPFQLPYDPHKLSGRLGQIVKRNPKSVSRKDRRGLRDSLNSVITSLDRGVGPGYSTAGFTPLKGEEIVKRPNEDGMIEFGYRMKLRLGNYVAAIETWSLLARVDMLKIIFRGHLLRHLDDNPVVAECLSDAEFSQMQGSRSPKRSSPKKPGKGSPPKGGKR